MILFVMLFTSKGRRVAGAGFVASAHIADIGNTAGRRLAFSRVERFMSDPRRHETSPTSSDLYRGW